MRYLILLLSTISINAFAQNEQENFEQSKFQAGQICKEMLGTWYTDLTVNSASQGIVRHITKLVREENGEMYLKGVSVEKGANHPYTWEFASQWSCDGSWYVEKNEWGMTAFQIKSFSAETILIDARENFEAGIIEFAEKRKIDFENQGLEDYFN